MKTIHDNLTTLDRPASGVTQVVYQRPAGEKTRLPAGLAAVHSAEDRAALRRYLASAEFAGELKASGK